MNAVDSLALSARRAWPARRPR